MATWESGPPLVFGQAYLGIPLPTPHGEGPYKSWAKYRKLPDKPSWKTASNRSPVFRGRTTQNQTGTKQTRPRHPGVPMSFGAWNARTLPSPNDRNAEQHWSPKNWRDSKSTLLPRVKHASQVKEGWMKSAPGTSSSGKGGRKASVGSILLPLPSKQPLYACTN